jgi:hypothetical protein
VRILLDESLPRTLAALLAGHDVETVSAMRDATWCSRMVGYCATPNDVGQAHSFAKK